MKKIAILFSLLFLFFACQSEKKTEEPKPENPTVEYTSEAFLQHFATEIRTAFSDLEQSNNQFGQVLETFNQTRNIENLSKLQEEWKNLYTTWINASVYNIGPAGARGIRRSLIDEIALFPIDKEKINFKIETNEFKIDDALRNTRGLVVIEYLLFSKPQEDILTSLTGNRLQYLNAIYLDMDKRIEAVNTDWQGDYYNEFLKNNGTDVKSSITQLFNSWYTSFMLMKRDKIGVPIGLFDEENKIQPTLVENYYSSTSIKHLKQNIAVLQFIWTGGERTIGWDDYVASKEPNGKELEEKISSQIKLIYQTIDKLDSKTKLSEQIIKDKTILNLVFEELKELEVLIDTEMSGLLGLAVTASDKDGD